jgi:hypothetical protein
VLLVVTNPVDPLCTWALRRSGIDRRRLVGYTINDSLRLRTGIGQALGVDPRKIDAWTIGEHGDGSVPLFDRVTVNGEPVELNAEHRAHAEDFLRTWYVKHVALDSGRSSTWTSGVGVARMAAALGSDEAELWPASVALEGRVRRRRRLPQRARDARTGWATRDPPVGALGGRARRHGRGGADGARGGRLDRQLAHSRYAHVQVVVVVREGVHACGRPRQPGVRPD